MRQLQPHLCCLGQQRLKDRHPWKRSSSTRSGGRLAAAAAAATSAAAAAVAATGKTSQGSTLVMEGKQMACVLQVVLGGSDIWQGLSR